MIKLLFADAAAVVSTTRAGIEEAAHILDKVTEEWGLKMSIKKTKLSVAEVKSKDERESMHIIMTKDEAIQVVSNSRYLGSIIECQDQVNRDVEERMGKASRAFGIYDLQSLWTETRLLKKETITSKAIILGILFYGSEAWRTKKVTKTFRNISYGCYPRRVYNNAVHGTAMRITN